MVKHSFSARFSQHAMVAAGSLSINGIDIASYAINFVLSTGSSNFIYYLAKLVCDGLQNYLDFKDTG